MQMRGKKGRNDMASILIIEDEISIAELERDYLELSGFEVEIETSGTSGLERALKEDFNLIILDLMLKELMDLISARRFVSTRIHLL